MPDFSAAVTLLRKPLEDLYALASGELKEQISKIKATAQVRKIHTRLWQSQRVKTIWHTSKPLSLSSFFHPVSVIRQTDTDSSEVLIESLNDLPDNHNTFFGTVGQGKSILLRFLLGKEIKSAQRIPLFFELRDVQAGQFEAHLLAQFSSLLDVEVHFKLFQFFAENGKLTFLLDGFDEVEPSNVSQMMRDIELLSNSYPLCRIALTSRPDSECKHLTNFHSVTVAPLKSDDLQPFYRRLTRDIDFTNSLLAAVAKSPTEIRTLLTTPLLATLLAISYQAAQKIPLDFAEFYDDLFEILLTRHDGAKKGWRRARKTKLNDREVEQVFEAFCFATRKKQLTSFDRDAAYQMSKDSIEKTKVLADPESFLTDITKVTCLILVEGKKWNFVHSSVQEFFSARFVRSRPEPVAANFYGKLREKKIWASWRQELLFLMQIDSYRSKKYFLLPDQEETLNYLLSDGSEPNEKSVQKYLSNLSVRKARVSVEGKLVDRFHVHRIREEHTYHLEILDTRVFRMLFSEQKESWMSWNTGFRHNLEDTERTYAQIATDRGAAFEQEFHTWLKAQFKRQVTEASDIRDYLLKEEAISDFVDLDDV